MLLPHKTTRLPVGHFMRTYWGREGAMRPTAVLLLRGPTGNVIVREAVIDTGSPYVCFSNEVADELQLPRPYRRTIDACGAAGDPIAIGFPDDGAIRLCISDFATEWFVWAPLIGILPTRRPAPAETQKQTAILGWTGFLQYFNVSFLDHPTPLIEVTAKPAFAGRRGTGRPGNVWATP
jgi:hypothetical protein